MLGTSEILDFLIPNDEDQMVQRRRDYSTFLYTPKKNYEFSIKIQPIRKRHYTARQSFTGQGQGEISVKKNEEIEVLMKKDSGWWLVQNANEQQGWIPAAFVSKPV